MKEMEIMAKPYQPFVDDIFSASNIRECEKHVLSLQMKLDKAVANNDTKSIRETFNLLCKSANSAKVLAVYRITKRNQGRYTAGVDGVNIPKDNRELQEKIRLELLNDIDIVSKPKPIKRIFIPKPNGDKRPLGIPTLKDRINQEILRMALEPIVEYHFSNNSWGFRPKRSCHDAVSQLYMKLSQATCGRYIVEGDIKGCFDNISHEHIAKTLQMWKVPQWAISLTNKMLKSKIFHNGEVIVSDIGTPQGGVISPLLANVALTSLDYFCLENYGYRKKRNGYIREYNPIVRYADDFVIVCESMEKAKLIKSEISEHLLKTIGLTLSEEKTKITHITKGFNFLGFNFRKYAKQYTLQKSKSERNWSDYTLLIKPQKENIINFLSECKAILDDHKTAKQHSIIQLLTPKMVGWAMFYRHVVSKKLFARIDHELWKKFFFWSKRRHPKKSTGWIVRKYFSKVGNQKHTFKDKETGLHIPLLSRIPIKRFVILNGKYRVYDKTPETREYWKKRNYMNAYDQITSVKLRKLFVNQQGKCPFCKDNLFSEQISERKTHIHHMLPRSLGGNEDHSNLRLLHDDCHMELHRKLSREQMSEIWKTRDYLRHSE